MSDGATDPRDAVPQPERERLLALALELTDLCAATIESEIGTGLAVERKADKSVVTSADRAAELAFRNAVAAQHPEHGVLGEEFPPTNPDAALRWVIDPIDGTAEFARQMPYWGVIIGLYMGDDPLLGVIDHPDLGERVHAAHGLGAWHGETRLAIGAEAGVDTLESPGADFRVGLPSRHAFTRYADQSDVFDRLTSDFSNYRTFHSCYAHSAVVTGSLDVTVEWDSNPWDLAAARVLTEEAGGCYRLLGRRELGGGRYVESAAFGVPDLVGRVAESALGR